MPQVSSLPIAFSAATLPALCAVIRRFFLVGANPTQQLSFQLVATKAVYGGNNMD